MRPRSALPREIAAGLLRAWSSTWQAEEHALQAAARDHMLTATSIRRRLDDIRAERDRVRALLA
jgi:hypothetical protein